MGEVLGLIGIVLFVIILVLILAVDSYAEGFSYLLDSLVLMIGRAVRRVRDAFARRQ